MIKVVSLSALIDEVLEVHHTPLKEALPKLSTQLMKHPEVFAPFHALQQLLTEHLMKEETILFPNIKAMEKGELLMGCGFWG